MARFIACYTLHDADCTTRRLTGCDCRRRPVIVNVVFTPGHTMRESIARARDAANAAAAAVARRRQEEEAA
jgi:hypothetical protein